MAPTRRRKRGPTSPLSTRRPVSSPGRARRSRTSDAEGRGPTAAWTSSTSGSSTRPFGAASTSSKPDDITARARASSRVTLVSCERPDESVSVVGDWGRDVGSLAQPTEEIGPVPVGVKRDLPAIREERIFARASAVLPRHREHGPRDVREIGHSPMPEIRRAQKDVPLLHRESRRQALRPLESKSPEGIELLVRSREDVDRAIGQVRVHHGDVDHHEVFREIVAIRMVVLKDALRKIQIAAQVRATNHLGGDLLDETDDAALPKRLVDDARLLPREAVEVTGHEATARKESAGPSRTLELLQDTCANPRQSIL